MKLNRRDFLKATVATTLFAATPARAAVVAGRCVLKGTPPPEKLVDLSNFADVTKAYPELVGKLATRHYVVGTDGGFANVFVYIKEGLEGRTFPLPGEKPVLDQINAGFHPYVLGVRANQPFIARNSEPYMDSVHALPRKAANKEFNIAQPVTGMITQQVFPEPELLIKVKCEIHPWEFAFINVVEHPFFAVTDKTGAFRLPEGLAPGKYVLEAVHPKAGAVSKEVEFVAGQGLSADFIFEVKPAVRA